MTHQSRMVYDDLKSLSLTSIAKLTYTKEHQTATQEVPSLLSLEVTIFSSDFFIQYANLYCQHCHFWIIMDKSRVCAQQSLFVNCQDSFCVDC